MEDTVPPQIDHYYVECENDLTTRVKLLGSLVTKELNKTLKPQSTSTPISASGAAVNASRSGELDSPSFRAIVFCGSEDNLMSCYEEVSKRVSNLLRKLDPSVAFGVGNVRYLSESSMFLHERSKTLDAFR